MTCVGDVGAVRCRFAGMGMTLIRILSINMNVAQCRVNMQIFSETCQRCGGDRRISLRSLIVSVLSGPCSCAASLTGTVVVLST